MINVRKEENYFTQSGILIFIAFFAAEYAVYELFYTYVNHKIWENQIPYKYICVINILIIFSLYLVIIKKGNLLEQIYYNLYNFREFDYYLFWLGSVSLFAYGSYLVYNVLYAKILDYSVVGNFIDTNLYVKSASNPYSLVNGLLLDPIICAILYQGFLLSWLNNKFGFSKASLLTALVYGYFCQDIIGSTLYCLVLNLIFVKTNNIIYPAVISSVNNLAYIILYTLSQLNNSSIFILQTDLFTGEANVELSKGVTIMLLFSPLIIYIIIRMIKEMEIMDVKLQASE